MKVRISQSLWAMQKLRSEYDEVVDEMKNLRFDMDSLLDETTYSLLNKLSFSLKKNGELGESKPRTVKAPYWNPSRSDCAMV